MTATAITKQGGPIAPKPGDPRQERNMRITIEYTCSEDTDPTGDHIVVTPPDNRVCDSDHVYFGEEEEREAEACAEEMQDAYQDEFGEKVGIQSEVG